MQAGAEQNKKGPNKDNEIIAKSQDLRPSTASEDLTTRDVGMATISIPGEPPVHKITRSTTSLLTNASTTFIPKGRSIAHHDMARKGTVYISFDIETGGEYCGILQISAEIVRVELSPVATKKGPSPTLDYDSAICRKAPTINRFVKPGEGAIWNENVTTIHGIHSNHPSIVGAEDMDTVWKQCVRWYEENKKRDEVSILMAYNWETYD